MGGRGAGVTQNSSTLSNPTSNYKVDESPNLNSPGVQLEEGRFLLLDRNKRKPADAYERSALLGNIRFAVILACLGFGPCTSSEARN
jgi:hypothetical protein